MNRKQLEEAIKRNIDILNDARTQDEILNAQLAAMPPDVRIPPDVWIPPDGAVVRADTVCGLRISSGELNSKGDLKCYCDGKASGVTKAWPNWKRLPNNLPIRIHDGSSKCPCGDERIFVINKLGEHFGLENPKGYSRWDSIRAYAILSDLELSDE